MASRKPFAAGLLLLVVACCLVAAQERCQPAAAGSDAEEAEVLAYIACMQQELDALQQILERARQRGERRLDELHEAASLMGAGPEAGLGSWPEPGQGAEGHLPGGAESGVFASTPPLHGVTSLNDLTYEDVQDFRYCRGLLLDQCRAFLGLLDELLASLEDSSELRVRRSTMDAQMLSRIRLQIFKLMKRSKETGSPTPEQVLQMYQKWRKDYGYGRAVGRWGRSTPDGAVGDKAGSRNEDAAAAVAAAHGSGAQRTKRAAPEVELQQLSEQQEADLAYGARAKRTAAVELTLEVRSILRAYKEWRDKHGYGRLSGRWGR